MRDWYRVLRVGGFMVIFVPHKYLYERKSTVPSFFNPDHKRFYTAASLLREFEESLPANGFRIRHLADNDYGFDHSTPIGEHARGCYEIELVVEKIPRPAHSDLFELSPEKRESVDHIHRFVLDTVADLARGHKNERSIKALATMLYFPTYEVVRSKIAEQGDIEEDRLKAIIRQLLPFVAFDEDLYLKIYPEVANAIKTGTLKSARDHFVAHGYFEGRVFQADPIHLDLPTDIQA